MNDKLVKLQYIYDKKEDKSKYYDTISMTDKKKEF